MGTPEYATVILKKLLEENFDVVALFTQPDKPVGRKQELTPPHIKQYLKEHNIDITVFQPNRLKEDGVEEQIRSLNPDFIIVAAYGQILPKNILDIAPCINLHASLLPKYRGASPIQQSLLHDDTFTGVSSMLMDVGLDSGDILGLKYFKIPKDMVVEELFEKLSSLAADLTIETLNNFENIVPKKQDLKSVTHCAKVQKSDGLVNFKSAYKLYNAYRAFKSWPDIYLETGLKIKECRLLETTSCNESGKILQITKTTAVIGCQSGTIEIAMVQPASKKQMGIVDYLRGKRLHIGDILE